MSNILTLKGVKDVTEQIGTRIWREQPTKGDTFTILKWWDIKGSAEYVPCVKIHLERVRGDLDLVIPASSDILLRVFYDGEDALNFTKHRGFSRIGLIRCGDPRVIGQWLFPKHKSADILQQIYDPEGLPTQGIRIFFEYFIKQRDDFNLPELILDAGFISDTPEDIHDLNKGNASFDLNLTH